MKTPFCARYRSESSERLLGDCFIFGSPSKGSEGTAVLLSHPTILAASPEQTRIKRVMNPMGFASDGFPPIRLAAVAGRLRKNAEDGNSFKSAHDLYIFCGCQTDEDYDGAVAYSSSVVVFVEEYCSSH